MNIPLSRVKPPDSVQGLCAASQGADITFGLRGGSGSSLPQGTTLTSFTTRPDTLFGVTHMVVAPEHLLLKDWQLCSTEQRDAVRGWGVCGLVIFDLEHNNAQILWMY